MTSWIKWYMTWTIHGEFYLLETDDVSSQAPSVLDIFDERYVTFTKQTRLDCPLHLSCVTTAMSQTLAAPLSQTTANP